MCVGGGGERDTTHHRGNRAEIDGVGLELYESVLCYCSSIPGMQNAIGAGVKVGMSVIYQ